MTDVAAEVGLDVSTDPELTAEQEHLAESRRQLARMRERTESMDSAAAGDWVSREYLQSTALLRMRQLADDPTIPLFFGRLDTDAQERFHIGRRHVSDLGGEPLVVDWRAPVSRPFYRASAAEPMGVAPDLAPPRSVRRSRGELGFAPRSALRAQLDRIAPWEGSIG
jgi:DNA helicase IV